RSSSHPPTPGIGNPHCPPETVSGHRPPVHPLLVGARVQRSSQGENRSAVVDVRELMLQPSFEKSKTGGQRTPNERDDAAALKTYRYLRLGMVVIVIGLLASMLIQQRNSGCWQGSISAYYY